MWIFTEKGRDWERNESIGKGRVKSNENAKWRESGNLQMKGRYYKRKQNNQIKNKHFQC